MKYNSIDFIMQYALAGYRVLPLWWVDGGKCGCGGITNCKPGKHPIARLVPKGLHDATAADFATLNRWWRECPQANVGIVAPEGIIRVDVDPRNGGAATVAGWAAKGWTLPTDTPTVASGRGDGGKHITLRVPPGFRLTRAKAEVGPGVDVLAPGNAYTVAPPSVHETGQPYRWVVPFSHAVANAPEWLLALLGTPKPKHSTTPAGIYIVPDDDGPEDLITHPGAEAGGRNAVLCSLVGVHIARGDDPRTIEALAVAWAGRCRPEYGEAEARATVAALVRKDDPVLRRDKVYSGLPSTTAGEDADLDALPLPTHQPTPLAPVLGADAYHGLLGDMLRAVAPETEAAPVSVLLGWLTIFGSCVGRGAWVPYEADRHYPWLFTGIVGNTSAGKGIAWGVARWPFAAVAPEWSRRCLCSGVGSGQGLVERVRDDTDTDDDEPTDRDKRCLLRLDELAVAFKLQSQETSILGEVLMTGWSGSDLEIPNRRKTGNALRASGYSLGVIGDTQPATLTRMTARGDVAFNGWMNRFLWCLVATGPDKSTAGDIGVLEPFLPRLSEAVAFGQSAGRVVHPSRGPETADLWRAVYGDLRRSADTVPHTDRARPQVVRLALLYALLDESNAIRAEHLRAALAVWEYCRASARLLFPAPAVAAPALDPDAAKALSFITASPGISRRGLYQASGGHMTKNALLAALALLAGRGLAHSRTEATGGRPAERWHPGPADTLCSSLLVCSQPKVAEVAFTEAGDDTLCSSLLVCSQPKLNEEAKPSPPTNPTPLSIPPDEATAPVPEPPPDTDDAPPGALEEALGYSPKERGWL